MSTTAFLEILLPQLSLESSLEMSLDEVLDFFGLNLSPAQLHQVQQLSDYYDVENLRSYLLGQPMTARGNLPRHRLQEKTLSGECSIPGTESFFDSYPDLDTQKKHSAELMVLFLKSRSKGPSSFAQRYYLFEYQLRHIFAFLRGERLERSYEVPDGDLSFSLGDTNTWPIEFLSLPALFQEMRKGPLEFEKSIAKWKLDYYEALGTHNEPFSFENILIYFLKLRLLESRGNMKNPELTHALERMAKAVQ
jgi:hypothetical protein